MEEILELVKEVDSKEVDSKTLVIFDVDMVLVQPGEPAFQMANMKRFSPICKKIMKEIPAEKQMLFLSLMTTKYDPVLISDCTFEILKQLKQKKIPVMALTANITGAFGAIPDMAKWRVAGLKKLGIDFSESAPFSTLVSTPVLFSELAPYRGNYSLFMDGVLFVNGTVVSKGEALLAFFKRTQQLPDKIIFIDDREENLKSVEASLQTLQKPIDYRGVHFLGAQKYPSKEISEQEFEAKWMSLASLIPHLD